MAYLVDVKNDEQGLEGSYNTLVCVREAFERLAQYEETGLTPWEIAVLRAENKRRRDAIESAWGDLTLALAGEDNAWAEHALETLGKALDEVIGSYDQGKVFGVEITIEPYEGVKGDV
jgi:hypothetical protein